jgi:hypothetical protein
VSGVRFRPWAAHRAKGAVVQRVAQFDVRDYLAAGEPPTERASRDQYSRLKNAYTIISCSRGLASIIRLTCMWTRARRMSASGAVSFC